MCEQESRKREEEEKPFSSVGRARQVPRLRVTSPLSLPVSCYSFSCSINKAKKAKKTFKKRNVTDDQPVWFILLLLAITFSSRYVCLIFGFVYLI